MPTFEYENQHPGFLVAGVDEAGRGPWAGPVVAGAVIIDQSRATPDLLTLLDDSKKLSHKKREQAYDQLIHHPSICWSVGMASVEEIDCLNILQATFLAMRRAVEGLSKAPDVVLVDGNKAPPLSQKAIPIIKGDSLSYAIAAASIVAKVTRDRMMVALSQDYPSYGWDRNSGYGTAEHQEALRTHGITPHHRRSYKPIQVLLEAA